jgi:hypothetical protein
MNDDARPRYRKGSVFGCAWRKLDRNALARLLAEAEAFDRRTHTPGRHGGLLGRACLDILRALVKRFYNHATGRLDPSYDALAEAAGAARSTAQASIAKLERYGFLERVRRLVRVRVRYVSPITGEPAARVRAVQDTNGYRLSSPSQTERMEPGREAPKLRKACDTESRSGTNRFFNSMPLSPASSTPNALALALERLGRAIASRPQTA